MKLEDLAPFEEEVVFIVMGPGFGESVMVRWPPDCWLIVDSFSRTRGEEERHPAAEALDTFGERADAVVLTHPHEDHSKGLAALIDRRKKGGVVGWWPEDVPSPTWSANPAVAHRKGANEQAVAAINRVWREEPAARWELHSAAVPLQIGEATLRPLTPLPEAVKHCEQAADPDFNEMSNALVVSWGACDILLGADLVNTHGWHGLAALHGELAFASTTAMKVAHHGSKEAQHEVALGKPPPTDRTYLAAPYNRGTKVPDFRDGEDVELLLNVMHRLTMSTHHGRLPGTAATADTPRHALLPDAVVAGPLAIELDTPRPPIYDCWVAARWFNDGTLKSLQRGLGSISIVA